MLPLFSQTPLQHHLTPAQFWVLGILLNLLQSSRLVKLERLASAFSDPITTPLSVSEITEVLGFASTNNHSDLVSLHHLLVNYLLPSGQTLPIAIASGGGYINILLVCLVCHSRAIPLFWSLLPKLWSSNITEQRDGLTEILPLLKDDKVVVIGNR